MKEDNEQLPASVKKLLWEYRDNISLKEHARLIIERVLDHGSADDVNWLFQQYDEKSITEVILNSLDLDPKTANFWALKLELKEKPRCLKKRSPRKRHKLWKY